MDRVSVVIPTYNRQEFLADAIDSVLSQTIEPFEIIVIDDGSTDSSEDLLKKYGDEIKVIRQENSGVSVARNVGIKSAHGSLIAFLDSDDIWLPGKLEREMEVFDRDQNIALVHSDIFLVADSVRTRPRSGRERFSGSCYAEFFSESPAFPILSTVIVRASALRHVGYFDERLRTSEDIDLWLRVSRAYRFAFIKEPLVLRRIHGQNLTSDMAKFFVTDLIVYEKAMSEDPGVLQLVGRSAYFKRLGDSAYLAGYWTYKRGNDTLARGFLWKSICYAKWNAKTWVLFFWTIVPRVLRLWVLRLRDLMIRSENSGV
jgi:glycosyltransferase involved in cell wall biosynthesis